MSLKKDNSPLAPKLLQLSSFSRSRLDIPPFLLWICLLYGIRTLFFFFFLYLKFSHLCPLPPLLYQQLSREPIKISDSASRNHCILPQWKRLTTPWLASFCFPDAFSTTIKWIFCSTLKVTSINDAHKTKKSSCPDRGIFPTLSHYCSCLYVPENQQICWRRAAVAGYKQSPSAEPRPCVTLPWLGCLQLHLSYLWYPCMGLP